MSVSCWAVRHATSRMRAEHGPSDERGRRPSDLELLAGDLEPGIGGVRRRQRLELCAASTGSARSRCRQPTSTGRSALTRNWTKSHAAADSRRRPCRRRSTARRRRRARPERRRARHRSDADVVGREPRDQPAVQDAQHGAERGRRGDRHRRRRLRSASFRKVSWPLALSPTLHGEAVEHHAAAPASRGRRPIGLSYSTRVAGAERPFSLSA